MDVTICNITIGAITYDFVHQSDIESTWEELTQKGKIILPANVKVDRNKLKDFIKKGDQVVVKWGYNGVLDEIFTGFVTRVHPKVPIEIEVEDLMWQLKQIIVNDTAKNETIQSFLERNLPGYEFDCFEVELPRFIANNMTGAQVLDQIKSDFGFRSFVRNGKIVVGKQYNPSDYKVHVVEIESPDSENVVISDDLEYMSKDDVKIKITAISNLSSGEKIEIELGDPDGESRTLNFYNLSEKDLRAVAEKERERLLYDGWRGTVTTFGRPFIQHGDVLEIKHHVESDKTGRNWVDGVNYSFGVGGIRQVVKLGART